MIFLFLVVVGGALSFEEAEHFVEVCLHGADVALGVCEDFFVSLVGGVLQLWTGCHHGISDSTADRIDNGWLHVRNIDLRRKVTYKPRKKRKKSEKAADGDQFYYRYEHTYEDYKRYVENHPNCSVVQMDTVVGTKSRGQRILTMLFMKTGIMLMILIPDGKAKTVVDVFDFLLNILGMEDFRSLFDVILTDNGPEFRWTDYLEWAPYTGERRCRVFYCDPMASWQKAELEKNHEFIRYVIPKGKSLDGYNHNDMTVLMNHINSTKRLSLNGRCPYEMVAEGDESMKLLMELMGMDTIPADDVHLKPDLLIR